jgi:uncharacterized protein (DUF362 family)
MNRRKFLQTSAAFGGVVAASPFLNSSALARFVLSPNQSLSNKANIAFVKTADRKFGIKKALDILEFNSIKGKKLFLKPNFNSSDPAPGSTHNDTLLTLIKCLRGKGADRITVGDRSGMGNTRRVMQRKAIFTMANELQFDTMVFDELKADEWVMNKVENGHWQKGFVFPKPVLEADGVIQTCCLKTHRYGGHFTMSLKNSVGFAAKYVPGDSHNYMNELHTSPYQRHMIAEINTAYQPDLVVLDGIEVFVDGGPASGKKVKSNVILAGTDRIAIDAVGVAILRYYGTTPAVSHRSIFQQEQIARAVELGLGVDSPDKIELVTDDLESKVYAEKIKEILISG